MFEFTHHRMKVYGIDTGELIPEEGVFKRVHKRRRGNHVSVIEGNVGTGKSELCAYIDLQLRKHKEKVLYLEKSADIVRMLTEDIPSFYRDCVGRVFPHKKELDELRTKLRTPRTVAEFGVLGLLMEFDLAAMFEGLPDTKEELMSYAARKLQRVATTPRVDAEIFESEEIQSRPQTAWSFAFKDRIGGNWDEVAAEMSRKFWEILYSRTGAPNLVETVRQLQKDCPQDRIYIIFEDYSFSRADTQKLLAFLEDDNLGNKCEVIIAGLHERIFGSALATATARERFDYYKTDDAAGNVPFLLDKDAFGFVLPFLAYPKAQDESIRWDDGKEDPSHPAPRSLCAVCARCPEDYRAAFPFTEPFLQKLYDGLVEKKPRILIDTVLKAIEEYAGNKEPISSTSALSRVKRADYDEAIEDQDSREFMAWYGTSSSGGLSAPAFAADIMGIADSQLTQVGDALTYVQTAAKVTKPVEELEDPLASDLKNLAAWIPNWKNDPTESTWQTTSLYIVAGISAALYSLSDGFRISDRSPIRVGFKKGESPVVFVNQPVRLNQIPINPKDLTAAQAEAFLKLGFYTDKRRGVSDDDIDRLCSQLLVQWMGAWQTRMQVYLGELQFSSRSLGGRKASIEDLALASYCIAAFLKDPWMNPDFATLQTLYAKGGSLTVHPEVARRLEGVAAATFDVLLDQSKELHSWLGYHFGLDETTLEKARLGGRLDFSAMLGMAATLSSADIKSIGQGALTVDGEVFSGPVNLVLGEESLKDVVTQLKAVANRLLETPFSKEAPTHELMEIRKFDAAYGAVESDVLRSKVTELLAKGSLPGIPKDHLHAVHAIANSRDKYDRIRSSATRIRELLEDSRNEFSVSRAWYMWQLMATDRDYQDLTSLLNDLDGLNVTSEALRIALERLRTAIRLFAGADP